MPRPGPLLLVVLISCLSIVSTSDAQTPSHVYTSLIPNQAGGYAVEIKGYIEYTFGEQTYLNEYMILYPEQVDQWNGRLVVGLMGRPADYLWFNWGNMHDMVGQHALDEGYAMAMVNVANMNSQPDRDEVNRRFLDFAKEQIGSAHRTPEKTFVVGFSRGGTLVRAMAESDQPPMDGALIISGSGGDLPGWLERQARILQHWTEIDPKKHPNLADTDKSIKAYAKAVGTSVEARNNWGALADRLSAASLRNQLATYGLESLSDEALQKFRIKEHQKNQVFMDNIKKATSTGRLTIPVIEIIGMHDDLVYPEVIAYAEKAKQAIKKEGLASYRLYQVQKAWHMGGEIDFWIHRGRAYKHVIEQAFTALDQWVSNGVLPPDHQTFSSKAIGYAQGDIERETAKEPLILMDLAVTASFEQALDDTRAEAERLQSPELDTQHLMLALMKQTDLARILQTQGMDLESVRQRVVPGRRRSRDINFKSMMSNRMTITTRKPVNEANEHTGALHRISPDEIALLIDNDIRIIPLDQVVGQIIIQPERRPVFKIDGALYIENFKRFTFSPQWYITTTQPVDGSLEHLISYQDILTDRLVGIVNDKERILPYDVISKIEIVDTRQSMSNRFNRPYQWAPALKQIFRAAIEEARLARKDQVDARHLLNALIRVRKGDAVRFLNEYDIQYKKINPAVQ